MSKSLSRILAVVGMALLLSVVAAPVASAGYKKGQYAGTTEQGHGISFKAKKLGVTNVRFEIDTACEDGSTQPLKVEEGASAPTNDRGKFEAGFTGDASALVKGKLKRKKAEGTIEASAINQETGSPCSSTVQWSAKRQ